MLSNGGRMRTSYQIEFLETMYVSYASENALSNAP